MQQSDCDILIVGGGLVGCSLACALEGGGFRTLLAEASAPASTPPSFDERHLALAQASRNALTALGVWQHLRTPPSPLKAIEVSSRGDFGRVRLRAGTYGLDSFGAAVIARELGEALETRVSELRDCQRLRPARVAALQVHADRVIAHVEAAESTVQVSARLLVAADGTQSTVRELLGIAAQIHDYRQTAFVTVLQGDRPHHDTAYERFTSDGPVAMLPLAGNRFGSICTVSADEAPAIAALDDDDYLAMVQQRQGYRPGRFVRVGRRSAYPLRQVIAARLTAPRAVLVGNAAQTLHPIGAQGFNLGLRDALCLAEELQAQRDDPGAARGLQSYVQRRREDREATMLFSDGLVRVFTNPFAPVRMLRSLGLLAFDRFPGLASGLVHGAMGFRGEVPRLAQGGYA